MKKLICPICKKPWIAIGNLLAEVFQEYYQDCDCNAEPVEKKENE